MSPSPEFRVPETGSNPPIGSDRDSGRDSTGTKSALPVLACLVPVPISVVPVPLGYCHCSKLVPVPICVVPVPLSLFFFSFFFFFCFFVFLFFCFFLF